MREMRCTAVGKGRNRVGRRWNVVMSHTWGVEGQAHVQSGTLLSEDFIAQARSYVPQCAAALDILRQAL